MARTTTRREQRNYWDSLHLLNSPTYAGNNALHTASRYGRVAIVSMLLSKGAVLEARNSAGHTALAVASYFDKPKVCKLLLALGADLRAVDKTRRSAVTHYGCFVNFPRGINHRIKVKRVDEMEAIFRSGTHPSQSKRRKDELRQVALLKRLAKR